MTLRCPVHHLDLVTQGPKFWCPQGHECNKVDLNEVLYECIGVLAGPAVNSGSHGGSGEQDAA
jgi:hypothetical protein